MSTRTSPERLKQEIAEIDEQQKELEKDLNTQ